VIISRTPLHLSFFGEGSDLPAYYRHHGGAVLSTAVEHSIYVTASRKFDDGVRASYYARVEEVAHASQLIHPLVRESLACLGIERGIEITAVADIPNPAGIELGSPSSFTVGLLNALHGYCGRHVSTARLASESCRIVLEHCGEPIGKQGQYAAAYGGVNFIRFHPDESVEVKKLVCPQPVLADLQARLLFFYTGVTRSALRERQSLDLKSSCTKSSSMREVVRLAEEGFAELCEGRIHGLGSMLHEAWRLKKELINGFSNPIIESAYRAARGAGAEGGKFLGANGEGFLMLFAPPARHADIGAALPGFRKVPFRFAREGSSIIFVH
jgi:D-glycero-alpha-D-manno-heptose-7-phosphate kinase